MPSHADNSNNAQSLSTQSAPVSPTSIVNDVTVTGAKKTNILTPKPAYQSPSRRSKISIYEQFLPRLKQEPMAKGEGGRIYHYRNGLYVPDDECGSILAEKVWRKMSEHPDLEKYWEDEFYTKAVNHLKRHLSPVWSCPPRDEISLLNGLLNLETGEFRKHSPDFRTTVQIPIIYDPQAKCPAWDKFHASLFDEESIPFMLEFESSLLTPRAMDQVAIWLKGEGKNGKSTYVGALKCIIGHQNCGTFNLATLESDPFAVAELNNKLLAVDYDAAKKKIKDASLIKKLITGDEIQAQRKWGALFTMLPTAKMMFLSNHPIESDDKSDGFRRRWLNVPMERIFIAGAQGTEPQDIIWERLSSPQELSGLLNQLIPARQALAKRGKFSPPLPVKTATEHFQLRHHPFNEFIDKCMVVVEGNFEFKDKVHEAANSWAMLHQHPAMSPTEMGLVMNWRFPEMPREMKRPTEIDGKIVQKRVYSGICLK